MRSPCRKATLLLQWEELVDNLVTSSHNEISNRSMPEMKTCFPHRMRETFDWGAGYWYKTRSNYSNQIAKGITMRSSQGHNKEKQIVRKVKMQASANETRHSSKESTDNDIERPTQKDASSSSVGHGVTEEQYRARVSQKAYELYEKRQAVTHVEDWLEAERLVKTELLAEGQWAGSV